MLLFPRLGCLLFFTASAQGSSTSSFPLLFLRGSLGLPPTSGFFAQSLLPRRPSPHHAATSPLFPLPSPRPSSSLLFRSLLTLHQLFKLLLDKADFFLPAPPPSPPPSFQLSSFSLRRPPPEFSQESFLCPRPQSSLHPSPTLPPLLVFPPS